MLKFLFVFAFFGLHCGLVSAFETPVFGYSGQYEGEIFYNEQKTEATLEIVQVGSTIRGFINTKIKFQDDDGLAWEGTGLFVKGQVENNKLRLRFTNHQCSAVSAICSNSRALFKEERLADVSPYEFGSDYILYEIAIPKTINESSVQSGVFRMKRSVAIKTMDTDPFYGIWDIQAFGLDSLAYALPGPRALKNRFIMTLFSNAGKDHMSVFGSRNGDAWEPLYFPLDSSSYDKRNAAWNLGWYKHELTFSRGYVYGLVRSPGQENEEIDFEAVTFGIISGGY